MDDDDNNKSEIAAPPKALGDDDTAARRSKSKRRRMLTFGDDDDDDLDDNDDEHQFVASAAKEKKSLHDFGIDSNFIKDAPKLSAAELLRQQHDETLRNEKAKKLPDSEIVLRPEEKPSITKTSSEKKLLSRQIRELQGDIFDLMNPDEEPDELSKLNLSKDSMDWYKSMIGNYEGCKRKKISAKKPNVNENVKLSGRATKKSLTESIDSYKAWLDEQKRKIKETSALPEEEQPLIKHWLSNQICDLDEDPATDREISQGSDHNNESSNRDNAKIEKAKDISIFDVERYDISDSRNIINVRRREGS